MAITLADQFYLKALDNYPYDIDEVVEKLNYASSYDDEHPGVHCLYGRLFYEQLQQFEEAAYHFEQALAVAPEFALTYIHYPKMLLHLGEHKRALKLVKASFKIRGLERAHIYYREAQIFEAAQQFERAKASLELGLGLANNDTTYNFLQSELKRVMSKIKPQEEAVVPKEEKVKSKLSILRMFF